MVARNYPLEMSALSTSVRAPTLGECWLRTSTTILEHGQDATYDGLRIREIALVVLSADDPDPNDSLIAGLGDPTWSAWMHETRIASTSARRRTETSSSSHASSIVLQERSSVQSAR